MSYRHTPVLLPEALHYLNCRSGGIYVDCTLGGSGHARAICEKIAPGGMLIAIDQDPDAIAHAQNVFRTASVSVHMFNGNFVLLPDFLSQLNLKTVDGVLMDLGISSHQIRSSGRGFSFDAEEPLDMRMNPSCGAPAEAIVNRGDEAALTDIFRKYGEERFARRIARRIVAVRRNAPILTSGRLAEVVAQAIPAAARRRARIHPATRVFMALRIAVNDELGNLERFLDQVISLLNVGGRLCIIGFHSLEDRIVKQRFRLLAKGCVCPPDLPQCCCGRKPQVRILTPKVVRATDSEVRCNRLARSARLRAVERLCQEGDEPWPSAAIRV